MEGSFDQHGHRLTCPVLPTKDMARTERSYAQSSHNQFDVSFVYLSEDFEVLPQVQDYVVDFFA